MEGVWMKVPGLLLSMGVRGGFVVKPGPPATHSENKQLKLPGVLVCELVRVCVRMCVGVCSQMYRIYNALHVTIYKGSL